MDALPLDVQNIGIEVTVTVNNQTGEQESVQTRFFCILGGKCGQTIDMYADSPESLHTVVCPVHGKIGSFPTYDVYVESVRMAANKILAAKGHEMMSEKTKMFPVDDKADPKSSN